MAPVIAHAQADANAAGISGKAVTPYLLQRIFELTEGRSLEANIALVRNNARLAARIALEMRKLQMAEHRLSAIVTVPHKRISYRTDNEPPDRRPDMNTPFDPDPIIPPRRGLFGRFARDFPDRVWS